MPSCNGAEQPRTARGSHVERHTFPEFARFSPHDHGIFSRDPFGNEVQLPAEHATRQVVDLRAGAVPVENVSVQPQNGVSVDQFAFVPRSTMELIEASSNE